MCAAVMPARLRQRSVVSLLPNRFFLMYMLIYLLIKPIIMQTLKEKVLNGEAYEAPKCETIEVQNEGMLCASGEHSASHNPFEGSERYEW